MRLANKFFRYKLHHVLFWMIVFAVWYYFRYQDYSTTTRALAVTALKVTDLALLIYLTNYLLIPHLLYKKRYWLFGLSFIVMIVSSSALKLYLIGEIVNRPDLFSLSGNLKARLYDNVIPHFFLVTAGVAVKLLVDYARMQQRVAEIAKEKAETELNFLKSQINPHFLFNSLNAVYFLINRDNIEARNALHKFSEMLRYQLYEAPGEQIPIEKEIRFLKDYVDIQQLRKDEKYKVEFNCDEEVRDFSIEPLLLVSFIENAFKHISHHAEEENFVKMDIGRKNGHLLFSVENSKENKNDTNVKGGIGLKNVKRRLELLYPGKHQLDLLESEKTFSVNLKLDIS